MKKRAFFLFAIIIGSFSLLLFMGGCQRSAENTFNNLLVGSWVPDSVIANMDTTRVNSKTVKQGMAIMQNTEFTFFVDSLVVSNPKRKQSGFWEIIPEQKTIVTKWGDDTTSYYMQYDSLSESQLIISNEMGFGSFTTYYRKIKK